MGTHIWETARLRGEISLWLLTPRLMMDRINCDLQICEYFPTCGELKFTQIWRTSVIQCWFSLMLGSTYLSHSRFTIFSFLGQRFAPRIEERNPVWLRSGAHIIYRGSIKCRPALCRLTSVDWRDCQLLFGFFRWLLNISDCLATSVLSELNKPFHSKCTSRGDILPEVPGRNAMFCDFDTVTWRFREMCPSGAPAQIHIAF